MQMSDAPTAEKRELKVFCRQCGGDRYHSIVAQKVHAWSEEDPPISGAETWAVVECGGCRTLTFLHEEWFSEDYEMTERGAEPIAKITIYPPAPTRKRPEWSTAQFIFLSVPTNDFWVFKLHKDIYAAIGLRSLNLAAMGVRAIVDHIVSWKAGDAGKFMTKLERMREGNLISPQQVDVIFSTFDAGSAATHRGYDPQLQDVYTMLDIAESLMERFYVEPEKQRQHKAAADALKKNTPQRKKT